MDGLSFGSGLIHEKASLKNELNLELNGSHKMKKLAQNNKINNFFDDDSNIDTLSKSWYPPLRSTLSLLSKLYGVVDMNVFEDFARRCVRFCIQTLQRG